MYNLESEEKIENFIYNIRGKEVMLDSDLAKLYKCKNGTKEINQAVKNNPLKFPERFSWKLSDYESQVFLVKNFDQKIDTRGGKYKNPRVFTEQGVAMLATILKTPIATEISIKIMDAFVAMRHYIGNNEYRLSNMETKLIEHDLEIKLLEETFNKFEEKKKINEIYFDGQIFDAYSKILDIFKEASKSIIIIDSYADNKLLDIIKQLKVSIILITTNKYINDEIISRYNKQLKVSIILITTNKYINDEIISRYNKQYSNLKVIYDNTFHDRYFILDKDIIYHCGSSINRIGYKTFSINLISDSLTKKELLEYLDYKIKMY